MKITEYVKYDQHRTYLYEGLDSYAINEARDWERILRPIVEAQLTPDQINTLFQQAQQVATDAGGNRTGIGKGVDYVAAKAEAWEKIKTSLQNTGPVSGFEAQYDKLAEKIKEKTGGDQGIMKYIQMYRNFATENPKFQKFVYGLSIALVGILAIGGSVAAMSGGPVILGLLKMTDRLLQGDKFTSALWQGVKTGALAAVGVGVGKGIRNMLGFGVGAGGGGDQPQDVPKSSSLGGSKIVNRPDDFGPTRGSSGDSMIDQNRMASAARSRIANAYAEKMGLPPGNHSAKFLGGVPVEIDGKPVPQNLYTKNDLENIQAAKQGAAQMDQSAAAGKALSNPQGGSGAGVTPASKAGFEPTGDDDIDHIGQSKVNGKWVNNNDPSIAKQGAKLQGMMSGGTDILNGPPEIQGNKQLSAAYKALVSKIQSDPNYNVRNLPIDIQRFASQNSVGGLQATKDSSLLSLYVQKAGGGNMNGFLDAVKNASPQVARGATTSAADFEESVYEARLREELANRRQLPESQIKAMFRQVDEGVWDTVKKGASAVAGSKVGQAVSKGAGAVAQKVGTVATNMTTKVTADKLMQAWKAAGNPTDSAQVYYLMKNQGLDDATLASIFKAAKVRTPVKGAKTPAATTPADSAAPPATGGKKPLSQTKDAIRKRNSRAAAKAGTAPPAAAPAPAPQAAPQPAAPAPQPRAAAPAPYVDKGASPQPNYYTPKKQPVGFNPNDEQPDYYTPVKKENRRIKEAGETDTPLDKAAINKILMAVAQAGAGGGSPQQQAPQAGGSQQQQAPQGGGSQQQASQGGGDGGQEAPAPSRGNSKQTSASAGQAAPKQQAPASGGGYTGPDVPLDKAAINKILMSVAQAGA